MDALDDPDPQVPAAALDRLSRELGRVANRQQYGSATSEDRDQLKLLISKVASVLTHDSRRLKIEAARTLVSLPTEYRQNVEPDLRQAFELALDEYKRSLFAENDRAGSHMMLGSLHELLGDTRASQSGLPGSDHR